MSISIKVKFLGVLENVFGTKERKMTVEGEFISLRRVLSELQQQAKDNTIFSELFDLQGNPKRSLIILINGATHEALGGLDVSLRDGDEVVLLPTIHGGWFSQKNKRSHVQK